jgi:hypothetical protein
LGLLGTWWGEGVGGEYDGGGLVGVHCELVNDC